MHDDISPGPSKAWRPRVWLLVTALFMVIATYAFFIAAPSSTFPLTVVIESGQSVESAALELAEAGIVSSPKSFYVVTRLASGKEGIRAGAYLFEEPESLLGVVRRLVTGDTGISALRITFPEGETVREMALRVAEVFPHILAENFLKEGAAYEGYLFPDTYFFYPHATSSIIVRTMRENFDRKIASLTSDIHRVGISIQDVVTMASLIEKETRTPEDRRIVSGILWDRIDLGMALQVDAVFGYIKGTKTYSPTFDDLEIDSPYNTYKYRGLPPGPIGNPGLDALTAAVYPTKTPYLYYLTGNDGNMYYARTFEEHKTNRAKYLK